MNIPEPLLTSLKRQYELAAEDAQAKIPTPLTLIIKAIVNRYEDAVNAYAEAGIREDQRRRLEGPQYAYEDQALLALRRAGL